MKTLLELKDVIESIPVEKQAARIKKEIWETRFDDLKNVFSHIFNNDDEIEITRKDIFGEKDSKKKILKTLMWGYPTGGRGNNIDTVIRSNLGTIDTLLSANQNKNISQNEFEELTKSLNEINGLGISTWSKLLYFFNISVEGNKCEIFDKKIVESLNRKQIEELHNIEIYQHKIDYYYKYLKKINQWAKELKTSPDKIEVFLFSYNLYYKLD